MTSEKPASRIDRDTWIRDTWIPERVLFGAAYYTEYHRPGERTRDLGRDLDLMAQAHFSVIRVGESVWSTWEPDNGRFDLDWLQPVLDGAHERGISVVLGTPTYAVPLWLARQYPEIAGERQTGQRIGWGARQEVDFTHPAFRFHAERVIRRIVQRYADHPAIIGFQVDNEPGNELFHNHGVFQRFVDYLRDEYGDIETLNHEWGLVYWSHRLSTWADLWTPDGGFQPQYDAAWRRFQALQTSQFIAWQADIVREYASPEQFVTTCIAYDRPALDDRHLSLPLDVTAGNAYYTMQDGLALPDDQPAEQYWTTNGLWAFFQAADRIYASRQAPFLVTETNAGHIGFPWNSRPAYDGQWRQAGWGLVARGASMIEYWHWHTLHYGAETYWGGVLPHSGEPGRTYRELSQLGADFEAAGALASGLTPEADVAILWDPADKWLMQKYPALATDDGRPDERSYPGLVDPFYRGAFDAGLSARIVHVSQVVGDHPHRRWDDPAAFAAEYPVLVASGTYLCPDELVEWFRGYVTAGGHLILGPRTAFADEEARARASVMPYGLADLAGASYDEFSNLVAGIPVVSTTPDLVTWPNGASATRWADGIVPAGAQVVAGYQHPHFGQWAAVTTNAVDGGGRVTMVGTVPDLSMAEEFFRWVGRTAGIEAPSLPPTVTISRAVARDGRRVRIVHNWSFDPVTVSVDEGWQDALDAEVGAVRQLDLGPWDVRVLVGASGAAELTR